MKKYWYSLAFLLLIAVIIGAIVIYISRRDSHIITVASPKVAKRFVDDHQGEKQVRFDQFIREFNDNVNSWNINNKMNSLFIKDSFSAPQSVDLIQAKKMEQNFFSINVKLKPNYKFADGNSSWTSAPISFAFSENKIAIPEVLEVVQGHENEHELTDFVSNFNGALNNWTLENKIKEIFNQDTTLNTENTEQIIINQNGTSDINFRVEVKLKANYFFDKENDKWQSDWIEFKPSLKKVNVPILPKTIKGKTNEVELKTFVDNFNNDKNGWNLHEKFTLLQTTSLKEEDVKDINVTVKNVTNKVCKLMIILKRGVEFKDVNKPHKFSEKINFISGDNRK